MARVIQAIDKKGDKSMKKNILVLVAVVAAIIAFANLITASTPWIAVIAGCVAIGAFFFYMDIKESENSKKARK